MYDFQSIGYVVNFGLVKDFNLLAAIKREIELNEANYSGMDERDKVSEAILKLLRGTL